ncbi:GNAT family N-acetyltransferase [Sphingomonas flavalba]|uniref:GNAT family N-acetyltransferase n=1 Tax=Sphingomonas flavalba TaxID=2559804 RepID=UPI00109D974A|nr:GNAT family N-acetyltransferase [Sphingomonas flavalba]
MTDYRWAHAGELPAIASFFARIVALDDSYVSHGEVQTGLSVDGRTWVADLDARMAEDMTALGPERSVAVAMDGDRLLGATIVLWEVTPRVSFMVVEDMAIDPATRSGGVGAGLLAFVEAEGAERGMQWAFLESGLHNDGAHRFFERHGFHVMSKVFSKKLPG